MIWENSKIGEDTAVNGKTGREANWLDSYKSDEFRSPIPFNMMGEIGFYDSDKTKDDLPGLAHPPVVPGPNINEFKENFMNLFFKHLLSHPTFADDAEKTRQAGFLNLSMVLGLGYLVLLIPVYLLDLSAKSSMLVIDIAALVVILCLRFMLMRGKVTLAGFGLLTLIFVSITIVCISQGTIRTPAAATYLSVIIIAGAISGWMGIFVSTAASSLAILGLILAENAGMLPQPDYSTTLTQWVTYSSLFIITGMLSFYTNSSTREILVQTRQEIVERKQAQDAIRLLESRYRALFENAPDGICLINAKGKFTFGSPSAYRIFSYSEEEIIGMQALKMVHPQDVGEMKARFARLVNSPAHSSFTMEYRYLHKDGQHRWIDGTFTNLLDDPSVQAVVNNFRDITERKISNQQLQESNQRFQQLNSIIPEMFWMYDLSAKRFIFASPAFEIIWGRSCESLYADEQQYLNGVLADDRPAVESAMEQEARGEQVEFEYRVQRPDGSIRWVWERSFPVLDPVGDSTRCTGVVTDITERKQAEANAIYRQKLLEKVIQLGKNVTGITDLRTCLREIHRSIKDEIGFDRVGLFLYDQASNSIRGTFGTSRQGEVEDTSWFSESGDNNLAWYKALNTASGMIMVEDYQTEFNRPAESEMYGLKQYVTLSAWAGDHPVAVIAADNIITQRKMNPADLEALQLFAGYAGLAIENARMHVELEKRVEERTAELRQSELIYRALFENSNDGIFLLTPSGEEYRSNQRAVEMLGYTSGEYHTIMAADQRLETQQHIQALLRGEQVPLYEQTLTAKDGRKVFVEINLSPVRDAEGNLSLVQCMVRDISGRKQAEEEIRANSDLFHEFMRYSPVYAYIKDVTPARSLVLFSSENFIDMIGIPGSQMVGKTMYDLFPLEFAQKITADDWKVVSNGQMISLDEELNGRYYTTIKFPIIQGNRNLLAGYTIDFTERKKAEDAVIKSRDELLTTNIALEKANRLKDEFLASMSHELRTPLTGVLGLAESLQMQVYGTLNEKQLKALKNIENSGRHLLDIINDILDLSRIEANKLDLNFAPCRVSDACQSSLQLTKELANRKNQSVNFSSNAPQAVVSADPLRLKQMLVNLLSNAIKFTPDGGKLGVEVNGDEHAVHITVWDAGIGIAPKDMERLFKPFTQIDGRLSRQYNGTGLGLALVSKLAELHRGSISVESTVGDGSRFTISLPTHQVVQPVSGGTGIDRPAWDANTPESAPKTTVLVADDNAVNLTILNDFLLANGYDVITAQDGTELVELARSRHPAVILTDIQMPGMNGLQAIREIRTSGIPHLSTVPIIAVTALAMVGDKEKCLEAGANYYTSKPLKLKELLNLLQSL